MRAQQKSIDYYTTLNTVPHNFGILLWVGCRGYRARGSSWAAKIRVERLYNCF